MKHLPALPGRCESPSAQSILVVAPHYDDEVLGCGGLIARRIAAGAAVRILFLSDGGREREANEDREAYAERRRAEAGRVAELFGWAGSEHLNLPDGELAERIVEIESALERALLAQRPELLLLPSPLEISSDHRAAFLAALRLLSPLRTGELLAAIEGMEILLYEVNHPLDPDVLVDVSSQGEQIREAMAIYGSQEEKHPYASAGLGLRRYRTLSLGPEVALAEGYRRLTVADFTTRSAARLLEDLGGRGTGSGEERIEDGPLVSIVVRTKDRPDLLGEALSSIARQTYRRVEVVVVNDGGQPPPLPPDYPFPLRQVELDPGRGRAGAATAGIAAASGELLGFLDDDDLLYPEHLETLVHGLEHAGAVGVYSDAAVVIYERRDDGTGSWSEVERRLAYSRDFDRDLLFLDNYIPLNTLLIRRESVVAVGEWDDDLPFFEDWDFLIRLTADSELRHLRTTTCEYRLFRGSSNHALGEEGGRKQGFLELKERVLAKHRDRLDAARLARVIVRLREESVNSAESYRATKRELGELRDAHRTVTAEAQRLYGEEAALHKVASEQTERLSQTYAEIQRLNDLVTRANGEIERLNQVVTSMEATRAWRLHTWLHRRFKE